MTGPEPADPGLKPTDPPEYRSPGTKRRRALVSGVAVTVVLVLGVGVALVLWFVGRGDSPEAGAERYLEALTEGDADAVTAALTSDTALSVEAIEAFEAATAYLEDPRVDSSETAADGNARVSVSYDLDGETRTATFTVRQEGDRWLADADALGSIAATTSIGDAVGIGDAVLETSASLIALPAAYEVTAIPASILTGSSPAVVTPGATTEVAVEAALAPDAAERMQPALDAYLEGCTAPAAEIPTACGISVPWGADLSSAQGFTYRVDSYPAIALDSTGGFLASGGSYVVTVTGQSRDGSSADFTYRDDAWTLRGALHFESGELTLQAW